MIQCLAPGAFVDKSFVHLVLRRQERAALAEVWIHPVEFPVVRPTLACHAASKEAPQHVVVGRLLETQCEAVFEELLEFDRRVRLRHELPQGRAGFHLTHPRQLGLRRGRVDASPGKAAVKEVQQRVPEGGDVVASALVCRFVVSEVDSSEER